MIDETQKPKKRAAKKVARKVVSVPERKITPSDMISAALEDLIVEHEKTPCRENEIVITNLRKSLVWLGRRES